MAKRRSGKNVGEARTGPARCPDETETQPAESFAVITDGLVVDDQIEFSMAFDVQHAAPAFSGGVGLFRQCQLNQGEGCSITREPADKDVRIVWKQKIAHDDAERTAAKGNMRLLESREFCFTGKEALDLFGSFEGLRLIGRRRHNPRVGLGGGTGTRKQAAKFSISPAPFLR